MRSLTPTENQLHDAAADWLRAHPVNAIWYHTPNGGKMSGSKGQWLKRMGVLAGVADLTFAGMPHCPLAYVELKTGNGRLEIPQKAFRDECERRNIPYHVIKTNDTDELVSLLHGYLIAWGALPEPFMRRGI